MVCLFLQEKQVIATACILDDHQQQTPVLDLLIKRPWQIECARSKGDPVVRTAFGIALAAIRRDNADIGYPQSGDSGRGYLGHLRDAFGTLDVPGWLDEF